MNFNMSMGCDVWSDLNLKSGLLILSDVAAWFGYGSVQRFPWVTGMGSSGWLNKVKQKSGFRIRKYEKRRRWYDYDIITVWKQLPVPVNKEERCWLCFTYIILSINDGKTEDEELFFWEWVDHFCNCEPSLVKLNHTQQHTSHFVDLVQWCVIVSPFPGSERNLIVNDPHSPTDSRVAYTCP